MALYTVNDLALLNNEITVEDVDEAKVAAAEGVAEAQYHLALMFDAGKGVKRNPKEAERWYRAAAEQGHANAQYFLARMYSMATLTKGIRKKMTSQGL